MTASATPASSLSTPAQRLAALRQAMKQHGYDAWIVPSADPHMSEYMPEHWHGRKWVSGFTGSVGTLVVTATTAGVWVDSRYWEQAAAQLAGTGIELQKLGKVRSHVDMLADTLHEGAVVGVAPDMLSRTAQRQLQQALAPKGVQLKAETDLLDGFWSDRPPMPTAPVVVHPAAFVSETTAQKLARVRAAVKEKGATHHLISSLDDIAWLTNLRGSDVEYNPVFLAHLLVGPDSATLFVNDTRLNDEARAALHSAGIALAPYEQVADAVAALTGSLLVDPLRVAASTLQKLPAAVLAVGEGAAAAGSLPAGATTAGRAAANAAAGASGAANVSGAAPAPGAAGAVAATNALAATGQTARVQLIEAVNPSTLFKGVKSAADIAHTREAMAQDGAALCEFFADFEARLQKGEVLNELQIDELITAARARQPNFVSASFGTICGFNANAALPHYSATPEQFSEIRGDGMLLIDSGGQYLNGTTDITRVVPVGSPSAAQKRDNTLVLKAHIALSTTVFPDGIGGPLLDAICRKPMWQHQCDYGHGTGHGVGYFLNVHEGPQVISWYAPVLPHAAMREGMITSIEPGLYRPGQWGIRIENLVVNLPVAKPEETDFGTFLYFDPLTLCPIDTRLMDTAMMTQEEIAWVNRYHALVREKLAPRVSGAAKAWLEARTQPLPG